MLLADSAPMGTVHKFKRPPKNEGQFRGYRPAADALGKRRKRPLRGWQRSLIAWAGLIVVAAALAGAHLFL
jgi:hypothetical protein